MAEKIATRDGYGKALSEFAESYDFVVLDADLAAATKTGMFKKTHPNRFFNCGIAEGNMMGVAAGIASTGKTVFASSFAMFAAGRAYEQIRNIIGYPHLNVKIGASHAGITVGEDGATHQCNEDIALMRTIPGMVILNPADAVEARMCVKAALDHDGPVYMRFGRLAVPVIFDEETCKVEIGKGKVIAEGTDVTIIATGLMVSIALEAKEKLEAEGVSVRIVNMACIKPIDKDIIIESVNKTGLIVTAEEHNIIGGLGSAVAEVVCENCPAPVVRIGINDIYGKSGKATELIPVFGLDAQSVANKVKEALELKK